MKKKLILGAGITAAILVLAAAVYLAVNWMTPTGEGFSLWGLNLFGAEGKTGGRARVVAAPEKPASRSQYCRLHGRKAG